MRIDKPKNCSYLFCSFFSLFGLSNPNPFSVEGLVAANELRAYLSVGAAEGFATFDGSPSETYRVPFLSMLLRICSA